MLKVKLSESQTSTVIENICKLRHLEKPKEVFSGKPKWEESVLKEHGYEKFGKFAENYRVLIAKGNPSECFIIVDTGKSFEKYTILACANLKHLFIEHIDTTIKRPLVSICFTSSITNKQLVELNTEIFNFPYRFMILPELYFVCGSKTKIGSLTGEYELMEYEKTYNEKEYALINSNDPLIIAMNGIPGDLFKYSQLMFDTGVYKTVFIKLIQRVSKNPDLPIDALREDLIIGL